MSEEGRACAEVEAGGNLECYRSGAGSGVESRGQSDMQKSSKDNIASVELLRLKGGQVLRENILRAGAKES